jgi:hypothetical protein
VSEGILLLRGGGAIVYKLETKLLTALVHPTLFITWRIADRETR